jgi:hypothetical protein
MMVSFSGDTSELVVNVSAIVVSSIEEGKEMIVMEMTEMEMT